MIQAVSDHIASRLAAILADGDPVKYYAPGAERPKKLTEFPCIAGSWYLPTAPDLAAVRPQHEVFIASEEQQTIVVDEQWGGGELTGPAEWTVKPCPVPHKLHLQLDLVAAVDAHALAMGLMMLEAIPTPYNFELPDGRWAHMVPAGDPINLDHLEAPLFRTAYRYEITGVWIDRQAAYVVPSITGTDMDMGVTE